MAGSLYILGLMDRFWNRLERLAAIGTLIDQTDKWFRVNGDRNAGTRRPT